MRAFAAAIGAQHWSATLLTGHPGVTTTWIGGVGRVLAGALGVPDETGTQGPTPAYLALLRLPLAVVNGLAVVPGYLLLCRLLPKPAATLAAFCWALSPFLIAFSRLLHVDGLTATWSTLSLLLLLVAITPGATHSRAASGWALLGSGACAGLAVLSKSSALVLLPWAGLVLAAGAIVWRGFGPAQMRYVVARYAAWLAAAVGVFWACWPAMWGAPVATFAAVLNEAISNGGQPHASGNYFFGQSVADPGPFFYPVVVLWRSEPFMLIGLLALVGLGISTLLTRKVRVPQFAVRGSAVLRTTNHRTGADHQFASRASVVPVILALAAFVALFMLVMSVGAKKFDRYLLPAWPALEILAACGLVQAWQMLRARFATGAFRRQALALVGRFGAVVACATTIGLDGFYHPYYIAYYNPLLGGGTVAQHVLLTGWGEGMEQIGAWLRQRPDLEQGTVLTWLPPTLMPFLPRELPVYELRDRTLAMREPAPNYAVLYARGWLRQESPALEATVRQNPPLYTLTMHGITYATIYQLPRPYDTARALSFEQGALTLRGYTLRQNSTATTIALSWSIMHDLPGGAFVFLHVLDSSGRRVAQIDAPIDGGLFATWQRGQQFGGTLPVALPADLPPGDYRVVIGAYRSGAAGRLRLDADALPDAVDGSDAALLATFSMR